MHTSSCSWRNSSLTQLDLSRAIAVGLHLLSHMTQYKPTLNRWYALWQYSFIALLQSLLWLAYSSAPTEAAKWLGAGEGTLDMLLNEGPIAFIVALPFAIVLLSSRDGLARSVLVAAVLVFAGAAFRCAALLLPQSRDGFGHDDTYSSSRHSAALALVHVGSVLNAASAPFVVISPAYLSLLWFPPRERNTATSIATVSGAVGRGIGYLIGPALVGTSAELGRLLWLELGLCAVPLLCALVWNPNEPDSPPSCSAELEKLQRGEQSSSGVGPRVDGGPRKGSPRSHSNEDADFEAPLLEYTEESGPMATTSMQHSLTHGKAIIATGSVSQSSDGAMTGSLNARTGALAPAERGYASRASHEDPWSLVWSEAGQVFELLQNPNVVLVAVAGGLQLGVYGGWSGVLIPVLSSHHAMGRHALTATQAGWLGSANTFAGIGGAVVLGLLTDVPSWQRYLKSVVLVGSGLSAVLFVLVALGLPPFSIGSLQAGGFALQMSLCSLAGFARGGLDPLYFELAAEAGFPAAAGLAGGMVCFVYHATIVVFLALPPDVLARWALTLMPAAMLVSGAVLALARIYYARRDKDDGNMEREHVGQDVQALSGASVGTGETVGEYGKELHRELT